jgi:diguanylate cyclase (GGDEF)-like protein
VLPHNLLTANGLQVGSLCEMVLLSLALGARVNEMQRQSRTDELTKLFNRRFFDERVAYEFERAQRYHSPVSLLVADIDHFKQFNDRHGHDVGDQVLRLVAGRLAEVGGGGTAYRYGGEEFSVIFPGLRAKEAEPVLEALREAIESYRMAMRGEDRPKKTDEGAKRRGKNVEMSSGGGDAALAVTVSIGLASPGKRRPSPRNVLQAADEALYAAKQGGRNRVVAAK